MTAPRRVAIIGGGFSGSLLALRLADAGAGAPILIEMCETAGPGLAYGAAESFHALNVTVERMEVGLRPGFQAWLGAYCAETKEAVAEAGSLAQAFVPRHLFGRYIAERVNDAVNAGHIRRVAGQATGVARGGEGYTVTLADGRRIEAETLVLATGNLPPRTPHVTSSDGYTLKEAPAFVPDPWASGALAAVRADEPVLLIGSGLTAVDVVLTLQARGHRANIHTLSRHGLLPREHLVGGAWPPFTSDAVGRSPAWILKLIRSQWRVARRQEVPWQRVVDAIRPDIARIWSAWDEKARSRFLRHGRTFWDVHRHRMPRSVANRLTGLMESGQLHCHAGRLTSFEADKDGVRLSIEGHPLRVGRVINCTGPSGNFAEIDAPLFVNLRDQGLIKPDSLHLGIVTNDTQVLDERGHPVKGLHALGSLTRPAWWEITAVPDLQAQISRLVDHVLGIDMLAS